MGLHVTCQNCGHENQMGVIFCRNCGVKIDVSSMNALEQLENRRSFPIKNIQLVAERAVACVAAIIVFYMLYCLLVADFPLNAPNLTDEQKRDVGNRVEAILSRAPENAARVVQADAGFVAVGKAQGSYRGRGKIIFTADEATYALSDILLEGKHPTPLGVSIDFYGVPRITTKQNFHGVTDLRYTLRGRPEKGSEPGSPIAFSPLGTMIGRLEAFSQGPVMERFKDIPSNPRVKTFLDGLAAIEVLPLSAIQDDKELSKLDEAKALTDSYAFVLTLKPSPIPQKPAADKK